MYCIVLDNTIGTLHYVTQHDDIMMVYTHKLPVDMATGVSKQIPQKDTSIPMVIWLLFLILVCYGSQLADGKGEISSFL